MRPCRDCNTAQPALNSIRCEDCNETRRQIRLNKAHHKICYNCDEPASAGYRSCAECREKKKLKSERERARKKGVVVAKRKPPPRTNLNEGICLWCNQPFKTHMRCLECTALTHWYGASSEHGIDPRYVITQDGRVCLRCQGIFTPEINETEPIEYARAERDYRQE